MKAIFIKTLILITILSSCSKDGYEVTGTIKNSGENIVYLAKANIKGRNLNIIDSTTILADGHFKFSGTKDFPELVYLKIGDQIVSFFIENSKINIDVDYTNLHNTKIKGSKNQLVYEKYNKQKLQINKKYINLKREYQILIEKQKADSILMYEKKIANIDTEFFDLIVSTIDENTNSYAAAYIALKNKYYFLNKSSNYFENIISQFNSNVMSSEYGEKMYNYLAKLKKVDLNNPAPNFTLNNTKGKSVTLSNFKGKYVLIDFWASWCSYCRNENPNLVKLYKKFSKSNFEIIGISLDRKKEKWEEAISTDNLTWINVSDLKGWKCEVTKEYLVSGIPTNYLINKKGEIIAKNLFGTELEKFLSKELEIK